MNRRGTGILELIVVICGLVAAIGGAWYGRDTTPAETADEKVIVIDTQGREHVMELEPGRTYDATISPDGKIVVREQK
jgi:hypothetical protein